MIETIFSQLTTALSNSFAIALMAAFIWGVLSILLSPCHLSSIPLIIGYISSQGKIKVKNSFYLALVFAIGILITIAAIGLITASMGRLIGDVGLLGNLLVAVIFILIGLYLMNIISWNWSSINLGNKKWRGLWGAFILGLLFGIGLGPCTFAFLAPVLGVVFQTAATHLNKSILLLFSFGLGHCSIIVTAGSLISCVQKYFNWTSHSKGTIYLRKVAGIFVLLGGFYFIYLNF